MRDKYYLSFDRRYREVYSQGVRCWRSIPSEIERDLASLEEFLGFTGYGSRDRVRVLEPGCGEGHLAVHLARFGFCYTGVDVSESAVGKAREKLVAAGLERNAEILLGDATDLSFLPPGSYDLAVDNRFLHMLVTDPDRRTYLAGLRGVLKPRACVLFQELCFDDCYEGPLTTFEEYMDKFRPNLTIPEDRTAFNDGIEVKVRVHRVPARPRTKDGYVQELGENGFEVLNFARMADRPEAIIYARLRNA